MSHTKEPWKVELNDDGEVFICHPETCCEVTTVNHVLRVTDAERIVSCVNACVGIPNSLLDMKVMIGMHSKLAAVTAQRDKLLEALKDLVGGKQSGLFSIDVETCTEEVDYDNVHRASVVTTAKIWKAAHEAIKEVEGL